MTRIGIEQKDNLLKDYNIESENHKVILQNLFNLSVESVDSYSQETAEGFLELGLVMFFRKEHNKAIRYIEKAQKSFSALKDIENVAVCLAELSWIYFCKHPENFIRSLTLLNDASYLIENLENAELSAKITHYYGLITYREKHFGEALKYFRQAASLAEKDSLEAAKIKDTYAVHYARLGDFQVAIRYLKESLQLKDKINNWREMAVTYELLGRIYLRIEDYDNAYYYLNYALNITNNLGGIKRLCRLLCHLSRIYKVKKDFETTEALILESMELSKSEDNMLSYAFSFLEYVDLQYQKEGSFDDIVGSLKGEIYPILRRNNSIRGMAFAKRLEAKFYIKTKEFHKALELLHESLELFKASANTLEIAHSHLELCRAYRSIGENRLSLSSIREALRIAQQESYSVLVKDIEDEFSTISEDEWLKVVEERSQKFGKESENNPLLDALTTLSLSQSTSFREPLLSLLHVGQAMASEKDIDKLLITITEETKMSLNTDRATVFLLDKESYELWSVVATGMDKQEIRFPTHMGLAGHVAITGEIINIKDAYNDPRFNKDIDKKTGYRTYNVLCVPMRNLKNEIIGVFQVINKLDGEQFTQEDEALLTAVASSASIAIENTHLFKEQAILFEEQKRSFNSFINMLAVSIDARDTITAGHSTRVTAYTLLLADQFNLSETEKEVLEYASLLHDFGKIGIRDRVLCKEGILTEEEYEEIKRHAYLTKELLQQMYFQEHLQSVPEIASSHHEKYDGTGYFRSAKGEEIPLGGRIMAIADVFDAITSKRHYRDRMPMLKVLNIIRKDSGTHFDPYIVDVFFAVSFSDIVNIIIGSDGYCLNDSEFELFQKYSVNEVHEIYKKEQQNRTVEENLLIDLFENLYERKKTCNLD